jgi:glycosyltransferase involved in cell wall biosynthesis/uncharacterized protein (DUF362 family)
MNNRLVGVFHRSDLNKYPRHTPFSPKFKYPEYPFGTLSNVENDERENEVYDSVRNLLAIMQYDKNNFNRSDWNPLGWLIKPGDTVLLKPNLVRHFHSKSENILSLTTHGSVVRAILDYVFIALKGRGKIIIGDAPVQECNFDRLTIQNGLKEIIKFYNKHKVMVELLDFRGNVSIKKWDGIYRSIKQNGDPRGAIKVDLGRYSCLNMLSGQFRNYRVTCYDPKEMEIHHNKTKNEYLIAGTALEADVIIDLPKIKTHRKVGLTAALKNLVGTNVAKDWLPHHRNGTPEEGGDEYPSKNKLKEINNWILDKENASTDLIFKRIFHYSRYLIDWPLQKSGKQIFEGNWFGNDTAWRMAIDISRILLYASKDGKMHSTVQRKIWTLVDGIVAGEGEGPMETDLKPLGLLVAGSSIAAVDAVVAQLVGFNYLKIPIIHNAFNRKEHFPICEYSPESILLRSNVKNWNGLNPFSIKSNLFLNPSEGWKDHVELDANKKMSKTACRKVLIVGDSFGFPHGHGATARVHAYARGLTDIGLFVKVVCLKPSEYRHVSEKCHNYSPKGNYDGIPFEYVCGTTTKANTFLGRRWLAIKGAWGYLRLLQKESSNNKVDSVIVFSNALSWVLVVAVASKIFRAKCILEKSEFPFIYEKQTIFLRFYRKVYTQMVYKLFNGVLVISSYLEQYFKRLTRKNARICRIPILVDFNKFKKSFTHSSNKTIVYAGSLGHFTEIITLLNIFNKLLIRVCNVSLQIIGDDPGTDTINRLKNYARELGINEKVEFIGMAKKEEIPYYLSRATILVLPRSDGVFSRAGFPTKLGEYLATGKPVVVTRTGEITEYLEDGFSAFLVPPDDEEAFVNKLEYVLSHRDESRKIGLNGMKVARAEFDCRVNSQKINKFIEGLNN